MRSNLQLTDIEYAVRLYNSKTEIGSAEIKKLFGFKSDTVAARLKDQARKVMEEKGAECWNPKSVDTECAYIQDENLQQRTTTEEDFIQCVNCEDCQFYLDAEIITRQQAEIENLKVENQSLRGAANSLKMHYEEAQAKIDKLNAENMLTMSERNAFLTSFNEVSKRLKSQKHALFEQQSYTADLQKQLKTAKSKAVKEFAERLKELDGYDNHIFDDCASLLVSEEYKKGRYEKTNEIWSTIDNLVKEMVGENNG